MERVFVLPCSTGNPKYDITEIINPAGDERQTELLEELNYMRKLLLIFRLVNQDKAIPDIALTIKNRDKQLCKPLLRLFQDTQVISEISSTLYKYLVAKRQRKNNTLDARVYEIIINLIGEYGIELENGIIWQAVMNNIEGNYDPSKPLSYETEEYYTISQKKITEILVDKFRADKGHDSETGKKRAFKFNETILKSIEANYSKIEEIKILKPSDTSDTSDTSTGNIGNVNEEKIDTVEHEIGQINPLKQSKNIGISVNKPSEPSEPSETKPRLKTTCAKCGYTDDAFYMKNHHCEGTD